MKKKYIVILAIAAPMLLSCSMTSGLGEGEQLYRGIEKISYSDNNASEQYSLMREELEAALACQPNGSFFQSSSISTPIQARLWIWNAFAHKKGAIPKWFAKTFGKAPVTMADANPSLRVNVAENVLHNNGFLRGNVNFQIIEGKLGTTRIDTIERPLTAKVKYDVDLGPLFTIDSLEYIGFSKEEADIFRPEETLLKKGTAFSAENLDNERTRIVDSLKNNGFYLYRNSYLTYQADTIQRPGKVMVRLCKLDSLPEGVEKSWYVGKTVLRIRREMREAITDTFSRGRLAVEYGGKKPPLRPRILLQDIKLRPGKVYSQEMVDEAIGQLSQKGIFSSLDLQAKQYGDSLSLVLDCILDKPYDLSLTASYTQKTSGRGGPGVGLGFTKRNAFRNGEILSINLDGSLDFTIGKTAGGKDMNYDLSGDVSLEMPKILKPKFLKIRRRWQYAPTTVLRLSAQTINRNGYFRRNIFSGELSYNFFPTKHSRHTFSPLIIDYSYMASIDPAYKEIIDKSVYLMMSHNDVFIPKMRYTYASQKENDDGSTSNFSVSLTEGGNLTNLIYTLSGKSWNEREKTILKTPYSQFIKLEMEGKKEWLAGYMSKLVGHAFAGYIHPLGNSTIAPYSEMYYMGGANDLRGFATRGLGPGGEYFDNRDIMYLLANANLKIKASLEYRHRFFGSFYGALFVDAGNIWNVNATEELGDYGKFRFNSFLKDIAISSGFGIRYDLDFFVIRVDWGFIVHAPYDTGRGGYFNTPRFSKAQCLNFAIGYPF